MMTQYIVLAQTIDDHEFGIDTCGHLTVGPFQSHPDAQAYIDHHVQTIDHDEVVILPLTSIWGPS